MRFLYLAQLQPTLSLEKSQISNPNPRVAPKYCETIYFSFFILKKNQFTENHNRSIFLLCSIVKPYVS